MRKMTFIAAAALLPLGACGGGASDTTTSTPTPTPTPSSTPTPTPTPTPTSSALDGGIDQVVAVGDSVVLQGSASGSVTWSQLSGPSVALSDATAAAPTFTAPNVSESTVLAFELADSAGTSDTVYVEIYVPPDASSDKTLLGDFTDRVGWACTVPPITDTEVSFTNEGTTIAVSSNGIARHATGTYPNSGNPNAIAAVAVDRTIPTSPVKTSTATEMGEFGVTLDGVVLDRDTAESYNNAGQWHYEAVTPGIADGTSSSIVGDWLGTDCNNAHVQPDGRYHYHGLMEGLLAMLGGYEGVSDMVLGGYAADGFPFYLRYGYADSADSSSGLARMAGSWKIKAGTRTSGPGGAYDGEFREDWEYSAGSGDLDECNGRFGPTPEYPSGIYHYYITDDYPYIPRCVFGTPDTSFRKST